MHRGIDTQFLPVLLSALLAALLGACAGTPANQLNADQTTPLFSSELFGERPVIVSAEELFLLRQGQQLDFLEYFNDPAQQGTPQHERIYEYLVETTAEFDFQSDTRTAAQTLDSGSGNCLSMAILTTALADLVEVDTGYQLVDSTPVFQRRGDVVAKSIHVRSILYDPTWLPERTFDTARKRPGILFDYFPEATERVRVLGNLSPAAYVAMYYSNVAGEAIAAGDLSSAYWYLRESLEHAADNSIALNMLAVVYRRAGDAVTAEQIYQYGIDHLPEKVSMLRNYRALLRLQGREQDASQIGLLLETLDDDNPFHWVSAGRDALIDEKYREAIKHLNRALDVAPYLHEAHALKAVAYLSMGNKERGERELNQALEHAQRQTTRSLYKAKLSLLDR